MSVSLANIHENPYTLHSWFKAFLLFSRQFFFELIKHQQYTKWPLKNPSLHNLLEQITEASSWWPQFSTPHPLCWQSIIELSLPEQRTSSSQIWSLPAPKCAECGALTASGNPSWRQTTRASFISQSSSQTVPQLPLWNTSTLPSPFQLPPTSLNPKKSQDNWPAHWYNLVNFIC